MNYLIIALFAFLTLAESAYSDEKTFPSVNDIFSNAYFGNGDLEDKYFSIGTGTTRCSAASEMAFNLNQRADQIFGSDLKEYIGGEPPSYWNKLSIRAEDIALFTLKNSGLNEADSHKEFEITYDMSIRLYVFLMSETDDQGMPNIRMLEQDLLDCKAFFSQDFENSTYMPRPNN